MKAVRAMAGRVSKRSRQTLNDSADFPFGNSLLSITRRPDADTIWRARNLDSKTLDKMPVDELVELLTDISPEISRALWDFIRMVNPGHTVEVFRPDTEVEDGPGQAVVDGFFDRLKALYGSPDVQINRMTWGGFVRGGFFSEIVFDEMGREGVDLATPDPYTADFKRIRDEVRGQVWQLGQYQGGQWVALDDVPTVSYIPIDPPPNSPYGRPLISAAVFTAIFIIGILHDLRRVIAQQGYPRIDLSIDLEKLTTYLANNPDVTLDESIDNITSKIQAAYSVLEPDDAYVHTDVVSVNAPVGTLGNDLSAIDRIISALERMAVRALKTMPLLLGLSESAGETYANRQWELHVAGIKSIQHLLESQLEQHLTILLQAQGIQADVRFRFAELRASEMLRDAQTEAMQIANAWNKYLYGWISQDQASQEITGAPSDQPEPRSGPGNKAPVTVEPEIVEGDGDGEEPEDEEMDTERMRLNGYH